MSKLLLFKTQDGSSGLYSSEIGDIYHARQGALAEAYEKFILPSGFCKFLSQNKSVRILDICYGIGYNTKAALYKSLGYSTKIEIDALDVDENLFLISPYLFDGINCPELKAFLIENFKLNTKNYDRKIEKILNENLENKEFLCSATANSNKKFENCSFNYYVDDARISLKYLNGEYDFVFLDAFSPKKDPTLWTYDFLALVKSKMNKNAVLATYSHSTPIRSALLKLGFSIQKTIINEQESGTIASLNPCKIKNSLSKIDLGLFKTKAGIVWRDENLNSKREEIIKLRDREILKSNLRSRNSYCKEFNL